MSYYLTTTELTTRMGSALVGGLTGLTGGALTTELGIIIDRQEAVIHGYIGGRYTTPLTSATGLLLAEEWTFKLCQYDIHMRGAGDDVQTKVRLDYEDTMKMLRDIQGGDMAIPGETAPSSSTDTTAGITIDSNDVVFDWGGDANDTF